MWAVADCTLIPFSSRPGADHDGGKHPVPDTGCRTQPASAEGTRPAPPSSPCAHLYAQEGIEALSGYYHSATPVWQSPSEKIQYSHCQQDSANHSPLSLAAGSARLLTAGSLDQVFLFGFFLVLLVLGWLF